MEARLARIKRRSEASWSLLRTRLFPASHHQCLRALMFESTTKPGLEAPTPSKPRGEDRPSMRAFQAHKHTQHFPVYFGPVHEK